MSWTEVNTPDGPMRIYQADPQGAAGSADCVDSAGGAGGAVIVIQEAFGVNHHIEDVARRFAEAGFHAVAPEMFHRAGPGAVAPYDDFAKVMPLFEGTDDPGVMNDLDATLGLLHDRGFADSSIGIVGFCWGGRVTFLAAARRSLGAGVGFYGGGIVTGRFPQFPPLVSEAASLQTPWLGLFGDQDTSIPVEDVTTLTAALESAPVDHAVIRYQDAGHGFHCDARPDHYNEEAAHDGWARAIAWFRGHLKV
jgi:carboxymethylenebutenolidase